MRVGEASINVVADGADFDRQIRRMIDNAQRRFAAFGRTVGDNARETRLWRDETGRLGGVLNKFTGDGSSGFRSLGGAAGSFASVLGGVVGTMGRIAAGGAAIGSLVGLLGAAAASATQFTAALAPAAGLAAGLPGVIGVAAAAVATLRVAVSGVGDAFSAAVSGDAEEFSEALEGLSPNAQAAATALRDITPAFSELRTSVQDAFFAGFDGTLQAIASTLVGPLTAGMTGAAAATGSLVNRLGEVATSGSGVAFIESSFAGLQNLLANIQEPLARLFQSFMDVGTAVNVAFGSATDAGAGLAQLIDRFAEFLAKAAESGQAVAWVEGAMEVFSQLGSILSPIIGILGSIGSAAASTGGNILGAMGGALEAVNAFLSSAEGMATLESIFVTLNTVGAIFGDVLSALLPIVAPLVGELVSGLVPVLESLVPLITQIGALAAPIFMQILNAVLPLVPPFASLAQQILPLVAMLLTSLVTAVAPLLEALTLLLVSVLEPLLPALEPILVVFGELAVTLSEILAPVIQLIGDILLWLVETIVIPIVVPIIEFLAELFSGLLSDAVQMFADLFTGIVDIIVTAATWLKDKWDENSLMMRLAWEIVSEKFREGWDTIRTRVFDPLKSAAAGVRDTLSGIWTKVKNAFQSVVDKFGDGKDAIVDALSGIWDGVKGAYNALASGWNSIDIEIGPFTIPDWVPQFGGATFHIADIIPDIPKLETGGVNLEEGIRWLHPNEAVIPLEGDRGTNALADALTRANITAGPGAGGDITVRVYIGDTELTEIIDVRIDDHDAELDHLARTGSGRR
mgnify:CR=1 FL=1